MDVKAFFKVGVLIIPVVSSLCCLLLLYMARLQKKIKFERGLVNPLMLYLAAVSFSWMAVMTYTIAPVLYVYINGLMYLCYLLIPVLFYHFVFNITKTSCSEKLNSVHYLIPLVLIGVFVGWSLFVPFDAQMYIVKNGGDYLEDYKLFSALFSSKLIVRLIFSIIYTSLSIARIYRYRKAAINYTANEETGSLRWLNMLLLLTFAIILLPLAATIFTRRQLISSVLVIFPFLLLLFQHVVLCYNMLARNYILIAPANGEDEVTKQPEMPTDEAENGKIDRLRLEQYILTYKPYLNPDFKITDLVKPLNTNRSYLSNFINTTYATNFSSYINRLRVNEYNSLVNMPEHEATPRTELVAMAGFGSYKTFLRWQQKVNEDRIDGSC